ncbi:hypothetical protein HAX54_025231, partial [Datura stramonium]|nr:hypothetical protein [Datura stramonium]
LREEEEAKHNDDSGEVSAGLQGALFESLGKAHSHRGSARMNSEADIDDDKKD